MQDVIFLTRGSTLMEEGPLMQSLISREASCINVQPTALVEGWKNIYPSSGIPLTTGA